MKVNDLRIGNWVRSYNPIIEEESEWQIYKTDMVIICEAEDISYYKPILLTEEWLLKFGFVKDKLTNYDWYKGDFEICIHDIKHVHQLQNLYHALTGEELKKETNEDSSN
jgi:hypothetical protein